MKEQVFQIQRMLANKLDIYRGRENSYIDDNIWKIQELYKDEENKRELKKEGTVEDKEVILIKLYKVSELTSSTTKSSFISNEVDNLLKYIKFCYD